MVADSWLRINTCSFWSKSQALSPILVTEYMSGWMEAQVIPSQTRKWGFRVVRNPPQGLIMYAEMVLFLCL